MLSYIAFLGSHRLLTALAAVTVSLVCASAQAHVAFDAPSPNTALVAGSEVEITWQDVIAHQTIDYHLELRTDPGTPGVAIASALPPTQHSLRWQVPSEICDPCWLYVLQDNDGTDYDGVDPISIVAAGIQTGDGGASTPPADSGGGGCAIAPGGSSPGAPSLGGLMLGIALLLGRGPRYRRTGARLRATLAGCRRARSRAASRRL